MKRVVIVVLAFVCGVVASPRTNAIGPDGSASSPEEARAWKALAHEFETVAMPQEKTIRAQARRILLALQKGEIESLVDECVMFDATAKDRRALTRQYLEEHRAELQAAALLADLDAPDFAKDLRFKSPDPAAGMPGAVLIPFGPSPPAPADRTLYPKRHELELLWSGPLMPEANGRVRASAPPGSKPGRWRFSEVIAPYSLHPMQRL